jgi:ubiquinone/menaquinone biosynthesis C-methylase UbiE
LNTSEIMKKTWDARGRANALFFVDTKKATWDMHEFFRRGMEQTHLLTEEFFRAKSFDPSGKKMLDIGCGVGRMDGAFAEMFGEVWGIDISEEMLNKAKKAVNQDNIRFLKVNGLDLKCFQCNFFDFVFSYLTFQHFPKIKNVWAHFAEIYRVLKPGGLFKVHLAKPLGFLSEFDLMPVPWEVLPFVPSTVWRVYPMVYRRCEYVACIIMRRISRTGNSMFNEELRDRLEALGFFEIEAFEDRDDPTGIKIWCAGRKSFLRHRHPHRTACNKPKREKAH